MDEAVVKRIMPHSNEAEQAVIGSMMMDQEAITVAMEKLSDADFYNKQYGSLFKAMVEFDDYRRRVKSGMVSKKEWLNCITKDVRVTWLQSKQNWKKWMFLQKLLVLILLEIF